jgi:hypothetical protein
MPATLRQESSQSREPMADGYVQESLRCNHEACDTRFTLAYHRDELRAEREGNPKAYPEGSTHETVLEKMREKANEIVASHHSLQEARNYVWAGIEKGWVVIEDLTAGGI